MAEEEATPTPEPTQADTFDIDLPDIPLPSQAEDAGINDKFPSSVAFKYAFCGSGQGGSRLAESFYKLGYRRVVAINTALQDLDALDLPQQNKLEIATGGAGKNPLVAQKHIQRHREDVYDLMARQFGDTFDRLFVLIGGGGGTGSGSVSTLVETAHELLKALHIENEDSGVTKAPKVGVICTLPMVSESRQVNGNAYQVLQKLLSWSATEDGKYADPKHAISPLVIVDNERVKKIYPQIAVTEFWEAANRSITSLFHVFNVLAEQPTRFTVFDKNDLDDVLSSGLVTFGATPVKPGSDTIDRTDISYAIRDNVQRNVLSDGLDLRTGSRAACIVVGNKSILNVVPQEALEHGFEQLTRIMQPHSVVHRGIYTSIRPGLAIYTMLGGLAPPKDRLKLLRNLGNQPASDSWDLSGNRDGNLS